MKIPPPHILAQMLADRPDVPQIPCDTCNLWTVGCNQPQCPKFQNYQNALLDLWLKTSGKTNK